MMLVAAMLLTAGNIFSNDSKNEVKTSDTLSARISQLLKTNNFGRTYEGAYAKILFRLNNDKEIVVLSVYSDKKALKSFVTNRLNYKEVVLDNFETGKIYTVSVRVDS